MRCERREKKFKVQSSLLR